MNRAILLVFSLIVTTIILGGIYYLYPQSSELEPVQEALYKDISSNELKSMMANKDVLIINVHIPYAGEINETDAFIPFNKISSNLDKLPADKSSEIIIYCRSGSMSATASEELGRIGYTNILNLSGSMNEWKESGFEISNNE
jgi:rhodanese-related sulfurtransferase